VTITGEDHSEAFTPRQDMVGRPKTAPAGAATGAQPGVGVRVRPCGVGGQAEPDGPSTAAAAAATSAAVAATNSAALGRRRARGDGHRTVRVDLRLNVDEAGALQQAAERTGMTRAGYAAAAALAAAGGIRAPRALLAADVRNSELLGALVAARFELAKVGVNLNQLARAANIDGTVLPEQLREVLARVDAGVRLLDARTVQAVSGAAR